MAYLGIENTDAPNSTRTVTKTGGKKPQKKAPPVEIPIGQTDDTVTADQLTNKNALNTENFQNAINRLGVNSTNCISDTFNSLQLTSSELEDKNDEKIDVSGIDDDTESKQKEADAAADILYEDNEKDISDNVMNLVADKGFHGIGAIGSSFDWSKSKSAREHNISLNPALTFTFGTKNTNTAIGFSAQIGEKKIKTHANNSSESDDNDDDTPDTDDIDSNLNNDAEILQNEETIQTRLMKTRTDSPSGNTTGENTSNTSQYNTVTEKTKDFDIYGFHNRKIKIKNHEYKLGLGADAHIHDGGNNILITARGIIQAKNGMRINIDSTRTSNINEEDGKRYNSFKNRIWFTVFDNEMDEVSYDTEPPINEESSKDEQISETTEKQPLLKSKNKFGLNLILQDNEIGFKSSYLFVDNAYIDKKNKFNRYKLYLQSKILDQSDDNKQEKIKINTSVIGSYEWYKHNDDFLSINTEVGVNNIIQQHSRPQLLTFGKASIEGKKGNALYNASVSRVKTDSIKISAVGVGYNYSNKKWNFGADASYVTGYIFEEPIKSACVNLNAAYKF